MAVQDVARTLYSAQVISASDTSSASVECGRFSEATIYIKVTAKAGTSPTLDFDVQTSHDNSDWHRDSAVTQISNPTTTYYAPAIKIANSMGKYIRLNPTVGGSSSPSMTVTATVVLKG
tara:strand:+ start:1328 stop:1684 length:357 start_codon:yes stop_codon:yes gene_type:complete